MSLQSSAIPQSATFTHRPHALLPPRQPLHGYGATGARYRLWRHAVRQRWRYRWQRRWWLYDGGGGDGFGSREHLRTSGVSGFWLWYMYVFGCWCASGVHVGCNLFRYVYPSCTEWCQLYIDDVTGDEFKICHSKCTDFLILYLVYSIQMFPTKSISES